MQLTPSQNSIFEKIKDFILSDTPVFILRGYAGTGKTTMVKIIADYLAHDHTLLLMAPTGRAARVLAEKTGRPSTTIHKAIYEGAAMVQKEVKDLAETEFKLVFPIRKSHEGGGKTVVIVDEASMLCSKTIPNEMFAFGTDNLMDDLLTFVRPAHGGKVIFVGDPAQLPPVGEPTSNALRAEYFEELGLKVVEAQLTEVLRQSGDSMILKNATALRTLLGQPQRTSLDFEEQTGDVERIPAEQLLPRYLEARKTDDAPDSVVICFTNAMASRYNREIRRSLYGADAPLIVGDALMVVQNNYDIGRMNGEFITVLAIGARTQQSAPVYVQTGGTRQRVTITLNFIQVTITDGMGKPVVCELLEDLLTSDKANISIDEARALYINFIMRHPQLKPGTEAFGKALLTDAYFQAIRAKYGYAVTGHKCQGGEWDKVFVDYTGRTGLDDDSLRWAYTATTRARQTLYVTNLPKTTPFSRFRIDPIVPCKKMPAECRRLEETAPTPYHGPETPIALRAKYHCICHNMEGTPYSVVQVERRQYVERYFIQTPDGTDCYELFYNASGIFQPAKALKPNAHTPQVEDMLNDERAIACINDYLPTSDMHHRLHALIQSACDTLSIPILRAVEHPEDYSVVHYFRTSNTFSMLKTYINAGGFVTYARPQSLLGAKDQELGALIYLIQSRFI